MKWILILLIFHGPNNPGIVQQEFTTAQACQDAKTVISKTINTNELDVSVRGYCFPL